jgi:outer membrane lipoprotein-sorting protein
VPPFSTKEPERYQATRIITTVEYRNGSADSAPETVIAKMLIARDGEKRREEYNSAEATTVFLEIPTGRFVLLPSKKLYADLSLASSDLDSQSDFRSEFSPERLLNETRAPTHYEKLGAETVDGRITTKYRVTTADSTNGPEDGSVTLIWIDESFGMPIRSETISAGGDHSTKLTVELRDLKRDVDPRLFDLPNDYKKADYRQLQAVIKQARVAPSVENSEPGKR